MQQQSFFGALFDFSFSSFVTTKIVKVLYVLAMIFAGLMWLVYAVIGFSENAGVGLAILFVAGPIFFLFSVIYTRVLLEFFIVIFRVMESNLELVALGRQANANAGSGGGGGAGAVGAYSPQPPSAPAWSPPGGPPTGPTGPMPPPDPPLH
jgi:hypothetical protein